MKWRRPLPLLGKLNAMARRKVERFYFAHKGSASSVKVGNEPGHRLLSFPRRAASEKKEKTFSLCSAKRSRRRERCVKRKSIAKGWTVRVSCSIFMGILWGDLYCWNENRVKRVKLTIIDSWIRFVTSWNSIMYMHTGIWWFWKEDFLNRSIFVLCKKQMRIILLFSQLYSVKAFYNNNNNNNDQTEQIL